MNVLAEIVGYLVIGAVSLTVIAGALAGIVAAFLNLTNVRYDDAMRAATAQMAARLIQDGYWFSEHAPTQFLLQKIAMDLTTHGWSEVSQLRDEWQRHMQKEREK